MMSARARRPRRCSSSCARWSTFGRCRPATTAREILAAFEGERLDYWVTGFGTGGTLKGVARVLKAERPETAIVVCEPDNSALLGSGIAQPDGASHPLFRPHPMQGWAPDFIAKLTQDAKAAGYIDRILPVSGADSLRLARELARQEGILAGISGGATLAGALRIAETAAPGGSILCMLPDTGERYLSTTLFEDVSSLQTLSGCNTTLAYTAAATRV